MNCYLCKSDNYKYRPGSVRDAPDLSILECLNCGLVYLPFSGNKDQHYKDSGMHPNKSVDIENWIKETEKDDERRLYLLESKIKNKKILDFGCGIGGFLEKAQQLANLAKGVELETAIQSSFKTRNLSVYPHLKDAIDSGLKWNLVTLFHVVEHLTDPIKTLQEISVLLENDAEIIIEVPNSDDALLSLYSNDGFQNFVYWTEHIYYFNESTLTSVIEKSGFKINWVKHIQRYPLSNHLYWLSNNKPNGHEVWNFINDSVLNQRYEKQLAKKRMTDTIIISAVLKN